MTIICFIFPNLFHQKKRKAKLREKNHNERYFDANLRFALLANKIVSFLNVKIAQRNCGARRKRRSEPKEAMSLPTNILEHVSVNKTSP